MVAPKQQEKVAQENVLSASGQDNFNFLIEIAKKIEKLPEDVFQKIIDAGMQLVNSGVRYIPVFTKSKYKVNNLKNTKDVSGSSRAKS